MTLLSKLANIASICLILLKSANMEVDHKEAHTMTFSSRISTGSGAVDHQNINGGRQCDVGKRTHWYRWPHCTTAPESIAEKYVLQKILVGERVTTVFR